MKKIIYFLLLLSCSYANAANIVFQDIVFEQKLLLADTTNNTAKDINGNSIKIDLDANGIITTGEALAVYQLNVSSSNISSLSGIEYFLNITILDCKINQLTTLDVSTLFTLSNLDCSTNLLTTLFVKNGIDEIINLSANAALSYICADEDQCNTLQLQVPASCEINSYCTLPPGGIFNTITGQLVFDALNNGIDPSDPKFPYIKIKCVIGTTVYQTVTKANGEYTFYIPPTSGNFTLSPVIENTVLINHPLPDVTGVLTGGTIVQNFTLIPIALPLPDLEVVIAPASQAIPAANSVYKIVYKNKGSKTVNGRVTLNYNNAMLTFVSSSEAAAINNAGQITLDILNIRPYETRDFDVVLNVNNAAVVGSTINFDVNFYELLAITESITDLSDNAFSLKQTIGTIPTVSVKCLEGNNVSASLIGKYLHYMINFENNSDQTIQNIMIQNIFDNNKFDMNSIEILYAYHPLDFQAKNNKSAYAFRNVNVGGPGGHGGILLKIKTNDNLPVGSSVLNNADIFFDYNHPLRTNDEQTIFQSLGVGQNNIDPSISIYPNPTISLINIEANNAIKTIELYDVHANLLQIKSNQGRHSVIDVSEKSNGIYFLKIISENGIKVEKIVKK